MRCPARTCSSSAARSPTRTSATSCALSPRRAASAPCPMPSSWPARCRRTGAASRRSSRRSTWRRRVVRTGVVPEEDLPGLFAGADAFLYPTLYEGFGLPVAEAMACGVPVLTSSTSALQEIAGGYAYLVDPLDVDAIARGIGDLATDAARRDRVRRPRPPPRRRLFVGPRRRGDAARVRGGARLPASRPAMKTAVVHDWLNGMRGGEKVLEAILPLVPEPTIFTLFHVPGSISEAIERHPIRASYLNRLPFSRRHYRNYLPLFASAVESFDLSGFDLVVSSSHCVAKGAIARNGAPHLCYCHTPVRYAWDQFDVYFPRGRTRFRSLKAAAVSRLRAWDLATAGRPSRYLANSSAVAERIAPPLRKGGAGLPPARGRRVLPAGEIRRPPAATSFSRSARSFPTSGSTPRSRSPAGSTARSSSSAAGRRRPVSRRWPAGSRVEFRGPLAPHELRELYRTCAAYLQPGEEDFGISAVEALACGAPVAALGRGGVRDIVRDGENGALSDSDDPDALAEAVAPRPAVRASTTLACGPRRSPSGRSASPRSFAAPSESCCGDSKIDAAHRDRDARLGRGRDHLRARGRLLPALSRRDHPGPVRDPGRGPLRAPRPADRAAVAGRLLLLRPLPGAPAPIEGRRRASPSSSPRASRRSSSRGWPLSTGASRTRARCSSSSSRSTSSSSSPDGPRSAAISRRRGATASACVRCSSSAPDASGSARRRQAARASRGGPARDRVRSTTTPPSAGPSYRGVPVLGATADAARIVDEQRGRHGLPRAAARGAPDDARRPPGGRPHDRRRPRGARTCSSTSRSAPASRTWTGCPSST